MDNGRCPPGGVFIAGFGVGYASIPTEDRRACKHRYSKKVQIMTEKSSLEEIRVELAKLQLAYEVLEKSHRRLVAKVLADRSESDHFVGQMVIDRTLLTPPWLKGR